jgi:hypothetical protein
VLIRASRVVFALVVNLWRLQELAISSHARLLPRHVTLDL